jgi:hypothetical protein
MNDHYWRVNKLKESHVVTRLAKERASNLKINDINDISVFGTPDCHNCCSRAKAGMLILWADQSASFVRLLDKMRRLVGSALE